MEFDPGFSKVYSCLKAGRYQNGIRVLLERRKRDGYMQPSNKGYYRIVLNVAEKGTTMEIKYSFAVLLRLFLVSRWSPTLVLILLIITASQKFKLEGTILSPRLLNVFPKTQIINGKAMAGFLYSQNRCFLLFFTLQNCWNDFKTHGKHWSFFYS